VDRAEADVGDEKLRLGDRIGCRVTESFAA
jgi:hypothetical protein